MTPVCSIFSQLLQLIPRGQFNQAVKQHKAERAAKGFTCWGQFVAMLFCQVAHMNSLREVCMGLACCEASLKQLGLGATPNPAESEPTRHNIEKLDPSLKCLRRPMNTGDHAWHEKYPAKDMHNSNG
jgi:hypothetical protein